MWMEMQDDVQAAHQEGKTKFWAYLGGIAGRPLDTRCIGFGKFSTKFDHTEASCRG